VAVHVGDLALDPAGRRVTRAGVEVSLTAREFALLEFLMRHAGDVPTGTQQIRQVSGAR
jgi:two-component system OmpR family response regulator